MEVDEREIVRWAKEEVGCTCDLSVMKLPSGMFEIGHSDPECPMNIKEAVFFALRRQGGTRAALAQAVQEGRADIDPQTHNVVDLDGNVLAKWMPK